MRLLNISPASRRFVWQEIRSKPLFSTVFVALSIVAGALEISGVGLIYPLLLIIVNPEAINNSSSLRWTTGLLGIEGRYGTYAFLLGLIGVLILAKNAFMGGFRYWQCRTLAKWKTQLSRRLMMIYLFSDFKIHMEKTTSEIIRNVVLTHQVYELFFKSATNMIVCICICIGLSFLLLIVLPIATVFAVGVLLATAMGLYLYMRKFIVQLGETSNELFRKRQQLITQSLGAIKEAKILGKEGVFVDKIVAVEDGYFSRASIASFLEMLPFLISETIVLACLLTIVFYEIVVREQQQMAVVSLGILGATLFRLGPQINKVLIYLQLMNVSQDALGIVSEEIEHYEPHLVIPDVQNARLEDWELLEFRNVSYSYPNSDTRQAVADISFEIRRNDFLGITGSSGCGKSTLMMLLLGLLRPTSGEILVDGQPLVGPDDIRKWQNGIGYVPQGAFLMEASLRDNILYAGDGEKIDEDRLRLLMDLVHLTEYIEEQPNGLDESVGENGSRLSGGQKQRVVIARSLYHDPDLLAFDEATSALDVKTERVVTDNLLEFKGRKTIVAIAHRLTTLQSCDRILLMDQGRLVALGTFNELKENCPQFQKIVQLSSLDAEKGLDDQRIAA